MINDRPGGLTYRIAMFITLINSSIQKRKNYKSTFYILQGRNMIPIEFLTFRKVETRRVGSVNGKAVL